MLVEFTATEKREILTIYIQKKRKKLGLTRSIYLSILHIYMYIYISMYIYLCIIVYLFPIMAFPRSNCERERTAERHEVNICIHIYIYIYYQYTCIYI